MATPPRTQVRSHDAARPLATGGPARAGRPAPSRPGGGRGAPPGDRTGPGADDGAAPAGTSGFRVHLDNFTGPFDLLLGLITKHQLDITEVALAQVTDEFIAHIRAAEADGAGSWDLGQASEFLVVAATLLDLKAARLLPSGEVDDTEDLELLEARDLLFARLLQYRAYKQVAAALADRLAAEGRRFPRTVTPEPQFAALLPDLVWRIGPEQLAAIAARALAPRAAPPGVDVSHLHAPVVSVREQAAVLVERLRRGGAASFRTLVADASGPGVVVVRFLALLELFREGAVAFDQVAPLTELTVRWTGPQEGDVAIPGDSDGVGDGQAGDGEAGDEQAGDRGAGDDGGGT